MTLIQRWNPSLNFPFILKKRISKVGPDYSFAINLALGYTGSRQRPHKLGALSIYNSNKQEPEPPWMILTVLSERSLASFNLQRMLRSSAFFSLQHIYAVRKLSNNLDEPPRSMVQSLLQKILVFKGGVKPPKSRPLIPLLSHKGFTGTIRAWLGQAVIPCHLSPSNVVAPAHLSLGRLVGNHHKMMEESDWDTPPSCTCHTFKERHAQMLKHANGDSQHVATRLCSLSFSDRLK